MEPALPKLLHFVRVAISSLFLILLISSQPHRVHHLFEGSTHSHQDPAGRHDHSDNQEPDQPPCIAETVAKYCHLSLASPVAFSSSQHAEGAPIFSSEFYISSHSLFPFSQRAPPII